MTPGATQPGDRGAWSLRAGRLADVEPARAVERAAAGRFAAVGHPELAEPGDGDLLPRSDLRAAAQDDRLIVAVTESGEVLGFALWQWLDGHGHLRELDVHPSWGGRGIGRALVEAVCARARARGASTLTLTTFRDVPFNAPFYARLGFVHVHADALGDRPALVQLLAAEAVAGFDAAQRCLMQRVLG
ncbi:MAG: GNAT family N-acetyltransferase [Pseudomonadales bacterium]|nr:GNAT family N-acetyltransferase [Pseudomonadales bacterium]